MLLHIVSLRIKYAYIYRYIKVLQKRMNLSAFDARWIYAGNERKAASNVVVVFLFLCF